MKMKSDAVTALVAVIAIFGSVIGWGISVERRLSARVKTEIYWQDSKELKASINTKIKDLKTELDTDIRIIRERLNTP